MARLLLYCPPVSELQVCCYVAWSLSATDKVSFHSYCVFYVLVFCLGVLAVYVRKSNGIFAILQPSEADVFCGQLLRGNFTECQEMSQMYLQIHSTSNARWNKKQWFLTVSPCIRGPDNNIKKKYFDQPVPQCYHLSASVTSKHSQRMVVPWRPGRIFMSSRFIGTT